MKCNVSAKDCNNNIVQLFLNEDEAVVNAWLEEYCQPCDDVFDPGYWLKGFELPEMGLEYRCQGWLINVYKETEPDEFELVGYEIR